jgi:hypothetical protein
MKFISAIWLLFLAVIISTIAAYFSVDGLAALFAATATGVIIMASALEAGKITVATWVHHYWHHKGVHVFQKTYLVAAVVSLMLVSSMGIYGYLAKGHLEQSAPLAPIELEIAQKQTQIDQYKDQITANKARLTQLDTAVNNIIGTDATKGLRARKAQTAERAEIKASIDATNTDMNKLSTEIVPLKLKINAVETKLGPVKYVAQLFGMKDPEAAVRIVIMLLMFSFDPLAIVLVLSGMFTLKEAMAERKERREVTVPVVIPIAEPIPAFEVEVPPDVLVEENGQFYFDPEVAQALYEENTHETVDEPVEEIEEIEVPIKSDHEIMIEILERKPELLKAVIDAVTDTTEQSRKTVVQEPSEISWLDDNWISPPAK